MKLRTKNFLHDLAERTKTTAKSVILPTDEVEKPFTPRTVPNRETLRRKGINITTRTGKGSARYPSRTRLSKQEYVMVYVKNENGRTIKKLLIPREMFKLDDKGRLIRDENNQPIGVPNVRV